MIPRILLTVFAVAFMLVSQAFADTTVIIHRTRPRILVPTVAAPVVTYQAPMVTAPDTAVVAPAPVVTYQSAPVATYQSAPVMTYSRSYYSSVGVGAVAVGVGPTRAERRADRRSKKHAAKVAYWAARS